MEDTDATQVMLETLFDIRGAVYAIHDAVVGGDDDGETEEEDA